MRGSSEWPLPFCHNLCHSGVEEIFWLESARSFWKHLCLSHETTWARHTGVCVFLRDQVSTAHRGLRISLCNLSLHQVYYAHIGVSFVCVYMCLYLCEVHLHVCTCVRYLRCHASCFWRVWNLLSSKDWVSSEPWGSTCLHLPVLRLQAHSTHPTILKKQFTQVLALMSQILCQLRNRPNPMFLFVSLLTPALGSSSTPCRTNHLVTWLKCIPSSWNMLLESTLNTSKHINRWFFWIMAHVLHDGSDCILQG